MAKKATYEELEQRIKELEDESLVRKQVEEERDRILNLSSDLICVADMDGYWKYLNPAWEKTMGYTIEETLARPFMDLIHPEDHKNSNDEVASLASGNETIGFVNRYISKDGSIRTISWRATYLPETQMMYCIGRDVTGQKRAEEEQKRLQKQLSNAMEIALLGHWEYDVANDLFTFNDHFYKMLRTTTKQVGGYTMSSSEYANRFVHPDDIIVVGEEIQKAIDATETNFRRKFQHRMIYADGTAGHISVQFFIVKDSQGRTIRTYGVNQDITDHKQMEEALRIEQERFSKAFRATPNPTTISRMADGTIIEVNETWVETFGYSRAEAVGTTSISLGIWADPAKRQKAMGKLQETGSLRNYETDLRCKSGEVRHVLLSIEHLEIRGEQCLIAIVHDITERKKMEEEKERLQSQLQQSQKMEAVGTLAGGIAHDFNNILAIILGNAELAADDVPDADPVSESLKEIRKASIRAKDMVRQLLAFSRKSDEKSKPLDMAPILEESMKMLRSAIPTSVEFEQHISGVPCNVLGDIAQINQIVMNLVTNAADAMSEEGGILEVALEKIILQEEKACFDWVLSPGPYVRIRMRDTGEGIEPEIMDRIFDPYYTTKEVGKGTGMGLSVIHGIVKRHGGGILVESELGKGTVFEIYFPAFEKTVEEEKEPEGENRGGSERILYVDDEESLLNLNRQRLERLGYQVKSTTKPVDALEWFKADPDQFDVVITDMTMPRMTGDRLTKEILTIRPHMPVIICTGYSERMSEKKAKALGVRKYLEKPIDVRNLA
ncbi:MAG: PAS domain S-box protein, partial [Nitrospina sp.]|nr:PAS domain S-box protein [Nitrospina sp.]